VIGISQDDAEATSGFMRRFGVTFTTLLDLSSDDYPASNAYGISSVPSLFLLERDGTIARCFNGFSKRDFEEIGARVGVLPFGPDDHVPEWKAG
jgi:peroxiredoxin